jgi:hypothetical protein
VDLTSQKLAFEKTDASVLGCGSSAVVYKGMLDNKPVAIKVRKARMPATLAAVQLKSCCRCRLSSSKGSPKLRARGFAYRLGVQISPRSVRAWHMQVYKDMKSELAIMTKPKDPNVLVVYGVYVLRPPRPRGVGGTSSFSVVGTFAGRRRRRSCCSSPICGTAPHATSSTIGSAESRSDLSCCIASSLHLSSASAALGGCAWQSRRRSRRRCLFCARLRTDSGYCTATRCARAIYRGDICVDERGRAPGDLAG